MQDEFAAFPVWVLAIDYILGMVMWTLIGRVAMNVFLPIDSSFAFMRFFVKLTEPILRLFRPLTPGFILEPLVPLYVAWFFYMGRFYLMPWLLGYDVMGMLSFPLEGEISHALYQMFYNK
ncbi:MAG: YggT family protein [Rhodospirillales bacterium]